MADQTPDVKSVDTGDGTSLTAAPALLTVSEHFDSVKPLRKLPVISHGETTSFIYLYSRYLRLKGLTRPENFITTARGSGFPATICIALIPIHLAAESRSHN
jgi:hypothetical protein